MNSPTMIRAASRDAHSSSASTTSGSRNGRSRRDSGMSARYASGVAYTSLASRSIVVEP